MMLALTTDSELDAGPKNAASGSERFCIVAREVKPVDGMLRFVVAPDGNVIPDLKRNLPGRGLWVTATREAVGEAVKRKAFARGFKRDVRLPAEFVVSTENLLERSALDALSIVGKAGQAINGFAKVEAALVDGDAVALLHASDAAPDGVRKLNATARRNTENSGSVAVLGAFTSAQLDLALGRSNVVHAALLAGAATDTFIARFSRLERFRTGSLAGLRMKTREIGMSEG